MKSQSSYCDQCCVTRVIKVVGDRWHATIPRRCPSKDECYEEMYKLAGIEPYPTPGPVEQKAP